MKYIIICVCVLLFFCGGCGQKNRTATQTDEISLQTASEIQTPNKEDINFSYFADKHLSIGNTIGFIRITTPGPDSENPDLIKSIIILDDDDTVWMSFCPDFYALPFEEMNRAWNPLFKPWVLSPDINVFVMRCVADSGNGYTVIINEHSGLTKRLQKHPRIMFETVTEHLQGILIGNDYKQNPLRTVPSDDSEIIIKKDENDDVVVVEISGEWIRLKDIWNENILGWVRWKKDNRFTVNMYYSL